MLGSALMKVAESGRFHERRELISRYTAILLKHELDRSPPTWNKGWCDELVRKATLIADSIEMEALK